jgi:hypothetical protein
MYPSEIRSVFTGTDANTDWLLAANMNIKPHITIAANKKKAPCSHDTTFVEYTKCSFNKLVHLNGFHCNWVITKYGALFTESNICSINSIKNATESLMNMRMVMEESIHNSSNGCEIPCKTIGMYQ